MLESRAAIQEAPMIDEHGFPRREFLKRAGATAAALSLGGLIDPRPALARGKDEEAEGLVGELAKSLTDAQRGQVLLPWDDPRRLEVHNNWHVVPHTIGRTFDADQTRLIEDVLRSVTSEVGYEKIRRTMADDAGGLENYSAALFSDGEDRLAFLLTGRHQTIRADGGAERRLVFGGPVLYGHAVQFVERPDHPGNMWWHQARAATRVYRALDRRQKSLAHRITSPADEPSSVALRGPDARFEGLSVADLSADQRALLEEVMKILLEPYRESDAEEVRRAIESNGGLEKLHMTFYMAGNLPDLEGIFDRWKIEGPGFAWYFRGTPHVHTWLSVAHAS